MSRICSDEGESVWSWMDNVVVESDSETERRNTMGNVTKAVKVVMFDSTTWKEAVTVMAGWLVLFSFLAIIAVLAGADIDAARQYFAESIACGAVASVVAPVALGVATEWNRLASETD